MTHRSKTWVLRTAAPLLLAAALTGCALGPQFVRTEVTNYNEWPTLPTNRSYTFARTLEFQASLEVKSYEDIVRDELAAQGFRYVQDRDQAELIVTLRPSTNGNRVRVSDPWADPFWGYGGFYGGFYGRRGYGWYDPFWSPFYGGFNYGTIEIFNRRLEMDIDSKSVAGRRYYEGRVESAGQSASFKEVAPYLVRALFTEFPGNNGQTRRVDVPIERR